MRADRDEAGQAPQSNDEGDAHSRSAVEGRLRTLWDAARLVVGVLLCFLGLLGMILPIVPGVPLLIAGVALLGTNHWLVRPFADWLARRRRGDGPV